MMSIAGWVTFRRPIFFFGTYQDTYDSFPLPKRAMLGLPLLPTALKCVCLQRHFRTSVYLNMGWMIHLAGASAPKRKKAHGSFWKEVSRGQR